MLYRKDRSHRVSDRTLRTVTWDTVPPTLAEMARSERPWLLSSTIPPCPMSEFFYPIAALTRCTVPDPTFSSRAVFRMPLPEASEARIAFRV
jgi:hypothetical protein